MDAPPAEDTPELTPVLRELIEALTAAHTATDAYRRWSTRMGARNADATSALDIIESAASRIVAAARLLRSRSEP